MNANDSLVLTHVFDNISLFVYEYVICIFTEMFIWSVGFKNKHVAHVQEVKGGSS